MHPSATHGLPLHELYSKGTAREVKQIPVPELGYFAKSACFSHTIIFTCDQMYGLSLHKFKDLRRHRKVSCTLPSLPCIEQREAALLDIKWFGI